MGVIFTHDVADDTSAFHMRLGRKHVGFLHAEDDAALDGFETIADIGDGAADDNRHRVVEEGRADFAGDVAVD